MAGSKRNSFKNRNIAYDFAIGKAQRDGNHNGRGGDGEYKVWEVETPCPPPPNYMAMTQTGMLIIPSHL